MVDDENNTLAYNRSNDKDEIVVAFNKSNQAKVLEIPVAKDGTYKDLLNGTSFQSEQEKLKVELGGMKAVILKIR
ncbi:MAG: hypothetical protein HC831_09230 [Chloroflexia bacterium]|nr:hypothetical protein [Chloroflexia bacterium]